MLEHLSRSSANFFVKECHRVLKKGGILRIQVPDIKIKIDHYLKEKDADQFLESTELVTPPLDNFKSKIHLLFIGYRHHQWMYDANSLKKLFLINGFDNAIEQPPGESYISDNQINLSQYKHEALYVEAIK